MSKKEIVINGNNFHDMEGFRDEFNTVLTKDDMRWTQWYNLDAFNAYLRGGFGVFEYMEPITLLWQASDESKKELGYNAAVQWYETVLAGCNPANTGRINELLQDAKQETGDTMFDILIQIIKHHEHIDLILA